MKKVKLRRYLANLGYGSRREVEAMIADGLVCDAQGNEVGAEDIAEHDQIRIDGEALDVAPGMIAVLNKPCGYVCSTKDAGALIYDLLPERWRFRDPIVSPVGRLDRDTSGLLLLTDDGQLLHRIISPKNHVEKSYIADLAADLRGDEAALFATGELMLDGEKKPLAPAQIEVLGPRKARLTLVEGRYHQVRRMFAAVSNHVNALHRERMGGLYLDDLEPGQWRMLGDSELAKLFAE